MPEIRKDLFVKINIEENAIETFIYHELMELAPYLNGGEKQKIAIILSQKFCAEWKQRAEQMVKDYERLRSEPIKEERIDDSRYNSRPSASKAPSGGGETEE